MSRAGQTPLLRYAIALVCLSGLLFMGCAENPTRSEDSGVADVNVSGEGRPAGDALGSGDGGGDGPSGPCIDVDDDGHCLPADCDDESRRVHPAHAEVCGNALDDNCDGLVDESCSAVRSFYVDRDSIGGPCADSNPGTEESPWCTLDQANAALEAGDAVMIRAGTYTGETISPGNSGSSDDTRITYRAYPGEQVTLSGSVYCIRIQSKSYITVEGLKFLDCERNLYIQASDHVNIGTCEFDNPGGPHTWAGSRIYEGSQYNKIYRSIFSRYGKESGSSGDYQDSGAVLDIGNDNTVDLSHHNLVVDSTFDYGGHHILGIYSSYNVVRGNTFHNEEWYACNRTDIGGMCGNRNVIINSSQPDTNIRNVVEDNWIVFAGVPPDQVSSAGLSVRTQRNIIRRNIFYYNDSAGITLSHDGGNHNDASHNQIYHNVIYKNGYLLLDDWDPRKCGLMLARWVDDAAHNAMTGVVIKNNIFWENQLDAINYYYVDQGQQIVDDNWEHAGDPGFSNVGDEPDPADFTALDFHLRGDSPCIDGGGFLTATTSAGQDSTALQVEDAGAFTDGSELVEGDLIQLEGQSERAEITAIDYQTDLITLDRPLTWEVGTGVSLAYHGARPDLGAFERPEPLE